MTVDSSSIPIETWRFSLGGNPPEPRDHLSDLAMDERTRIDQGIFPELGQRAARSRLGLRWILASYLNCNPKEVPLKIGAHGKPQLDCDSPLGFNLSHCGEFALLAISDNSPLGVDLERIREESPIEDLAQRCFSPEEQIQWLQVSEEKRRTSFFHLWVQKEAMVKARGDGMTLPLRQFSGETNPDVLQGAIRSDLPEIGHANWQFQASVEIGEMRSAIVYQGRSASFISRNPEEMGLSRW